MPISMCLIYGPICIKCKPPAATEFSGAEALETQSRIVIDLNAVFIRAQNEARSLADVSIQRFHL
tara:strand:+ start:195 stop:389 length:195 start_codon:yes stop_codon:yes gene_type:complete